MILFPHYPIEYVQKAETSASQKEIKIKTEENNNDKKGNKNEIHTGSSDDETAGAS